MAEAKPMPVITCIDDLKSLHKRRAPKMFFDYCESGSWSEQTFRDNVSDFSLIRLRQRIAVDMTGRSTAGEMIGHRVTMPVALAPVGFTGMQCADGEIKAARAAEKFGVPYTLSTMSICSIEDVAEHVTKPFWFQIYTLNDDDFNRNIINRARAAGCSALVITVDLQMLGQRHKDLKNGLSAPPKPTMANIINLGTKWRWGLGMLGTKRRELYEQLFRLSNERGVLPCTDLPLLVFHNNYLQTRIDPGMARPAPRESELPPAVGQVAQG